MRQRLGLQFRLLLLLLLGAALALGAHAAVALWPLPAVLAWFGWQAPPAWSGTALGLSLLLILPWLMLLSTLALAPLQRLLRALEATVMSYRDGDFSSAIAAPEPGVAYELAALMQAHSELGQALREQRQQIAQRELLLDTVVQNTPVALLLVDDQGRITFANLAARQLLAEGRSLARAAWADILAQAPAALAEALRSQGDQFFSVAQGGSDESFHLQQRPVTLLGRAHRLILLRRMTRELSRQEVASWKRVIRVLSHELNNSLAPISSMAHSGAELLRRGDTERLGPVLASISARAADLHSFLSGYASVAKLPAPRLAAVDWEAMLARLSPHGAFEIVGELPAQPGNLDAAQIEQALINLLKNAHEAGSAEVSVSVRAEGAQWRISVADRGPGMSPAVLAQALLPFYSTKRSGTGLGLALAREIAEAHGGRIVLAHREGGGLEVSLLLPR